MNPCALMLLYLQVVPSLYGTILYTLAAIFLFVSLSVGYVLASDRIHSHRPNKETGPLSSYILPTITQRQ